MKLVEFTNVWGEPSPCFIDPDGITGIVAAGLPGCSRIDRRDGPCVLVLGTPADVHALATAGLEP